MSYPFFNPYASGNQSSTPRQYGLSSAQAERNPQSAPPRLGTGSSFSSSGDSSTIPDNFGGFSSVSQSMNYRPEHSRAIKNDDLERSIDLHISRAREEVRAHGKPVHQPIEQNTDFTGFPRHEIFSSSTEDMSYPLSSTSASHEPRQSEVQSGRGSLNWSDYKSHSGSTRGDGFGSRCYGPSEKQHDSQMIPGLGDFEVQVPDQHAGRTETSGPKYNSESAADILMRFGLEKEDLEHLMSYPEDQITPATLPFILRQIRVQKTKRPETVGWSQLYSELKPTTSTSAVDNRALDTSEGSRMCLEEVSSAILQPSKVIDYGHTGKYTGRVGDETGRSSDSRASSGRGGGMRLMDTQLHTKSSKEQSENNPVEKKSSAFGSSDQASSVTSFGSSYSSVLNSERMQTKPIHTPQTIVSSFTLPEKDTDMRPHTFEASKLGPLKGPEPHHHLASKAQPPCSLFHHSSPGLVLPGSNHERGTEDQRETLGQGSRVAEKLIQQLLEKRPMQQQQKPVEHQSKQQKDQMQKQPMTQKKLLGKQSKQQKQQVQTQHAQRQQMQKRQTQKRQTQKRQTQKQQTQKQHKQRQQQKHPKLQTEETRWPIFLSPAKSAPLAAIIPSISDNSRAMQHPAFVPGGPQPITVPPGPPQSIPPLMSMTDFRPQTSNRQLQATAAVTKSLPSLAMMHDYAATAPRIFPHTCSLCNKDCAQLKEWISHQSSNLHLESCSLLRKRYPDWDGVIALKPRDTGKDAKPFASTSASSHHQQRSRRGSHSPSSLRSDSPHGQHDSKGKRENPRSRSPHSSRYARRSRSRSRSYSPRYDRPASSHYQPRSRSPERRLSPRRSDEKWTSQTQSYRRQVFPWWRNERQSPPRRLEDMQSPPRWNQERWSPLERSAERRMASSWSDERPSPPRRIEERYSPPRGDKPQVSSQWSDRRRLPPRRSHDRRSSTDSSSPQRKKSSSVKILAQKLMETPAVQSLTQESDLEAVVKTLAPAILAELAKMQSSPTSSSSKPVKKTTSASSSSKPMKKSASSTSSANPTKKTSSATLSSKPLKKLSSASSSSKPLKKLSSASLSSKPLKKLSSASLSSKPLKKLSSTSSSANPTKKLSSASSSSKSTTKWTPKPSKAKPSLLKSKTSSAVKIKACKPATMVRLQGIQNSFSHHDVVTAVKQFGKTKSVVLCQPTNQAIVCFEKVEDAMKLKSVESISVKGIAVTVDRGPNTIPSVQKKPLLETPTMFTTTTPLLSLLPATKRPAGEGPPGAIKAKTKKLAPVTAVKRKTDACVTTVVSAGPVSELQPAASTSSSTEITTDVPALTFGEMIEKHLHSIMISKCKRMIYLKPTAGPTLHMMRKNLFLVTGLPVYHDGCYTEKDLVEVLTPFGFHYDFDNIYVVPQACLAFVRMSNNCDPKTHPQTKQVTLKGSQLYFRVINNHVINMQPSLFYHSLKNLMNSLRKDAHQKPFRNEHTFGERTVFINNISPSEARDLRESLRNVTPVSNYLTLLNKVYVEFECARDADWLGVLYSLLKEPSRHNVLRLKRPCITSPCTLRKSSGKNTPPNSKDVPEGSIFPFWIIMRTNSYLYPTVSPWFIIPDYLTVRGEGDISVARQYSRVPTVMLTGLSKGNYKHEDVAKLVWPYFNRKNLQSLYYNVTVLTLQRRAFVFFEDWSSCCDFARHHIKNPASVLHCRLTVHIVLEQMNPDPCEELMYKSLMKLSNTEVADPTGLEERLLCVETLYTSVEMVQMIVEAVASIATFVSVLPLANRICFEMEDSSAVAQVVAKTKTFPEDHPVKALLGRKVVRFETLKSFKERLQEAGDNTISFDPDQVDAKPIDCEKECLKGVTEAIQQPGLPQGSSSQSEKKEPLTGQSESAGEAKTSENDDKQNENSSSLPEPTSAKEKEEDQPMHQIVCSSEDHQEELMATEVSDEERKESSANVITKESSDDVVDDIKGVPDDSSAAKASDALPELNTCKTDNKEEDKPTSLPQSSRAQEEKEPMYKTIDSSEEQQEEPANAEASDGKKAESSANGISKESLCDILDERKEMPKDSSAAETRDAKKKLNTSRTVGEKEDKPTSLTESGRTQEEESMYEIKDSSEDHQDEPATTEASDGERKELSANVSTKESLCETVDDVKEMPEDSSAASKVDVKKEDKPTSSQPNRAQEEEEEPMYEIVDSSEEYEELTTTEVSDEERKKSSPNMSIKESLCDIVDDRKETAKDLSAVEASDATTKMNSSRTDNKIEDKPTSLPESSRAQEEEDEQQHMYETADNSEDHQEEPVNAEVSDGEKMESCGNLIIKESLCDVVDDVNETPKDLSATTNASSTDDKEDKMTSLSESTRSQEEEEPMYEIVDSTKDHEGESMTTEVSEGERKESLCDIVDDLKETAKDSSAAEASDVTSKLSASKTDHKKGDKPTKMPQNDAGTTSTLLNLVEVSKKVEYRTEEDEQRRKRQAATKEKHFTQGQEVRSSWQRDDRRGHQRDDRRSRQRDDRRSGVREDRWMREEEEWERRRWSRVQGSRHGGTRSSRMWEAEEMMEVDNMEMVVLDEVGADEDEEEEEPALQNPETDEEMTEMELQGLITLDEFVEEEGGEEDCFNLESLVTLDEAGSDEEEKPDEK